MKNSRKHSNVVLFVLHGLNKTYNKLYCYPSQVKILSLLCDFQDIHIAIATLNRWLRDMEDKGYIIRVRRIKKDKRRGILFKSTLYKITVLGYHALKQSGISVWREIKAISQKGIKAGEHVLGKFKGPVSMKTILASTGMFGIKGKVYIEEK